MSTTPFQGPDLSSSHHLAPKTPAEAIHAPAKPTQPVAPSRYTNSLPSGSGVLHLSTSSNNGNAGGSSSRGRARFTTLIASYPLKLLVPTPLPSQDPNLAIVYTLAYGGGLVAADTISLRVNIDPGGKLVMLTQGSTKVFKRRPGIRPQSHITPTTSPGAGTGETRQRMHVTLQPAGLLLLLPDSISPFKASRYIQSQRFVLPADGSGSLVILDWVNSGRGSKSASTVPGIKIGDGEDEIWSMDDYTSTNEVLLGDRLIMRERLILDNTMASPKPHMSSVAKRLAPYHAYATLMIHGPLVVPLLKHLRGLCEATQQFQIQRPDDLSWSYSDIEGENGGIVRIAGKRIESVRDWIRDILSQGGVRDLVGEGIWPRVI